MSVIISKHFFHSSLALPIFVCLYYFTERARSSQSEVIPLFDVRGKLPVYWSRFYVVSATEATFARIHTIVIYIIHIIKLYVIIALVFHETRISFISKPLHRAVNVIIKPYRYSDCIISTFKYMIFIYVSRRFSCLLVSNKCVCTY